MALNPLDPVLRDIADIKRQLAGRSQLNHSSLENTAIPVYDANDVERLRIGAQDDGTHAIKYVQGPPPPRPTVPVVSVDGPVVRVRWDGMLVGGHIPEDFARIDVHFALASDDVEDASAVRANLATAAGSEATLMATQTGTYRVGLVAMSQSRARSEMSDTVEVEVQVVDLATAIESATQSANGKNTVVYSERSPEPTDEGAAGDTWFVNEVRPRDAEDPASGVVIAIIEQWRHTGTVWVQVEMAHEVIASVDLGRATVGLLSGQRIESESIDTHHLVFGAATGEVLSADAIDFREARGMRLVAADIAVGDMIEMNPEVGFRQYGPDGALNVSFPADGAQAEFRGDVSARSLIARQMQVQGAATIASGADLVLESGVTAPASAPQVSPYWERVSMPALAGEERAAGLVWESDHWWRAVTTTVPVADGGTARIEKITSSGVLVDSFPVDFRARINGLTALNGVLFVIGAQRGVMDSVRIVVGYEQDGTEVQRWTFTPFGGRSEYNPSIGTDGTHLIIGHCQRSTGELRIRSYTPSGTMVDDRLTGRPVKADIAGIYIGSADFGTQKMTIAKILPKDSSLKQITTYDLPGDTYNGGLSWYTPGRETPAALAWDGTHFWSSGSGGEIVRYARRQGSARDIGDDSPDWWMAASWRDSPAESTVGPAARFTWPHRSELLVTVPDAPQGVSGVAFFVARQEGVPGRTDLHWAAEINQVASTVSIPYLPSNWAGLRPPVGESSFTDREPGELRSAKGGFRVDGSGAGQWGSFSFHGDGTVTGKGTVVSGHVEHPLLPRDDGSLSSHDVTVTFPVGRFSSPPLIVMSQTNGLVSPVIAPESLTTDSFQLRVWNPHTSRNAGAGTIYWAAIEEG